MATPPIPLDHIRGHLARMRAAGTSQGPAFGAVDPTKVAPIPATMSAQTSIARKIGGAVASPIPDTSLDIKRAAEKADELRLKKANPGMTDTQAQDAFIPESRMKKLCEVVKSVRKASMEEEQNTTISPENYAKKQKLTIIAPDHQVADSPNARHLEEVLGRSNMSQLKVPSAKQGAINGGSRPLSQRTRGRYVYEEEGVEDAPINMKKKSAKELKQAEQDGVEVNPQLDD